MIIKSTIFSLSHVSSFYDLGDLATGRDGITLKKYYPPRVRLETALTLPSGQNNMLTKMPEKNDIAILFSTESLQNLRVHVNFRFVFFLEYGI